MLYFLMIVEICVRISKYTSSICITELKLFSETEYYLLCTTKDRIIRLPTYITIIACSRAYLFLYFISYIYIYIHVYIFFYKSFIIQHLSISVLILDLAEERSLFLVATKSEHAYKLVSREAFLVHDLTGHVSFIFSQSQFIADNWRYWFRQYYP